MLDEEEVLLRSEDSTRPLVLGAMVNAPVDCRVSGSLGWRRVTWSLSPVRASVEYGGVGIGGSGIDS